MVPVYNESQSLVELSDRVFNVFRSMGEENKFELIFVNDGSTDDTGGILRKLCADKQHIRSIFLRKNFGKTTALTAGFIHAKGDLIITIDGDLQDVPEDIPKMIKKINDGYDMVSGWKQGRQDSIIRIWGSWLFNIVVSFIGGIRMHDFNCGFKIYRASVINNITVYGQHHRFIPLIAHFLGFKVTELRIAHKKRAHGKSKFHAFRYLGFFDLLSIAFTYKYQFSPLYFFGMLGLLLTAPSFAVICFLTVKHILFVLGMGDNYMAKITLLLPLSTTVCLVGVNIFLAGFVCDFILCHRSKNSIKSNTEGLIEEVVE